MDLLVDVFFILSVILFISGILGVFVKAYNEKFKLRYLFLASLFCFSVSLTLGWEDAVKGFNEGYNDAFCCEQTEQ